MMLLVGCGETRVLGDVPAPAPTVTVTVTETVEPPAVPSTTPTVAGTPSATSERRVPRLKLQVFSDGCGVIRSEGAEGVEYRNLTWVFRDQDGFQVLGRNAEGETRYRYFTGGTYDVVLEAFVDGKYSTVSNEVTVQC